MRKATRISLALVTSAAMVGLAALPASAVDGDGGAPPAVPPAAGASATIEVEGGELSISVAPALTPVQDLVPGDDAVFEIEAVTVTDHRAVKGIWGVSVSMTNFTSDAQNAKPIPAANSTYEIRKDTVTKEGTTGDLVLTNAKWASESAPLPAVSAPGVYGNNEAGWQATLTVPVPSDTLAGTYTATLTHSFL